MRHSADKEIHSGRFRRRYNFFTGSVRLAVSDIFRNRAAKQPCILQHHSKIASQIGTGHILCVGSVQSDFSCLLYTSKVSSFDRLFDVNAVKIPYGGGYYKEVDEAVRRAISYNPRIKMVFRSLDKSFLMYDKDQWNPTAPAPDYLLDGNPWNDVNYIWNKEVIFGNVHSILNRTKAGADMTTFDEYMHWAPDKEWGRQAVLRTFERPEGNMEPMPFTMEDRQMVEGNVEQNILAVARANPDIIFYCFIPPYSIAYWDSELVAKGDFERQLSALRLMADMLLTCDNIRLFGFDDQFDIICDLDNYMDVIHYSEQVGDRILEWMAAGEHRLTRDNVDQYFETIRDFYGSYDYGRIYD